MTNLGSIFNSLKELLYRLKFLLIAVVLCGAAIGAYQLYNTYRQTDPEYRVRCFLAALQANKLAEAKKYFGGHCSCHIPGGWMSYLVYKSGQEPNLAYLAGRQFVINSIQLGKETRNPQSPAKFLLPVQVKLVFSWNQRPLFLPIKMAYGSTMSESELAQFTCKPHQEWQKGFSLRLRSSLKKGATDLPTGIELDKNALAAFTNSEELIRLLGSDVAAVLSPKDPGAVLKPDGTKLTKGLIARRLPFLCQVTINFHLLRSLTNPVWSISYCKSTDPVLTYVSDKKRIVLRSNIENQL